MEIADSLNTENMVKCIHLLDENSTNKDSTASSGTSEEKKKDSFSNIRCPRGLHCPQGRRGGFRGDRYPSKLKKLCCRFVRDTTSHSL